MSVALLAALLPAAVHLLVPRMRFLDRDPRLWSSLAGGVGIAYVFTVLLPKLAEQQPVLAGTIAGGPYGFLVHHAWLVALIGLIAYHGMDAATEHVQRHRDDLGPRLARRLIFRVHASGIAGYYFLIGSVIAESRPGDPSETITTWLFAAAMSVHFVGLDHGLRGRYGRFYEHRLQWVFAAASVAGAVTGALIRLDDAAIALLNALFAGGLLVLTIKDKVPGRAAVRFGPFLLGAVVFTAIVLVIEALGGLATPETA